jgi:hypothetical protein
MANITGIELNIDLLKQEVKEKIAKDSENPMIGKFKEPFDDFINGQIDVFVNMLEDEPETILGKAAIAHVYAIADTL